MVDTYQQDGALIQTKNETGGALAQGDVIVKTDSIRIVTDLLGLANNATGLCWARGVHTLPSLSADTWSDGQNIYWDDAADNLTNTSAGNTFAGSAVGDKAALETSNDVLLQAGAAATLGTDAVSTPKIADDAVTNDKLANITRGSVKVGGAANAPTDLVALTDKQMLIGDGTDIVSVAISGDITITNAGVTAVGAVLDGGNLADIADGGHGVPFVIQKTWPDADGDVQIYSGDAPFKFRVIDMWVENRAANGANANAIRLHAAAAEASIITDAISLNGVADEALVRAAEIDDTNGLIAASGDLYLHVTKVGGTMGGNANILCIRSA